MTETLTEEKNIYQLFLWSVLLKGAISVAEIFVGALFLFISPQIFIELGISLSKTLLPTKVAPLFTTILLEVGHEFLAVSAVAVALYLISRGLIKFALIWAMLKNQLWAYPSSLAVLGLFVLYQLYQIEMTHSLLVIGVTLFDLIVMYFIWREYRIVDAHRKNQHKKHLG